MHGNVGSDDTQESTTADRFGVRRMVGLDIPPAWGESDGGVKSLAGKGLAIGIVGGEGNPLRVEARRAREEARGAKSRPSKEQRGADTAVRLIS